MGFKKILWFESVQIIITDLTQADRNRIPKWTSLGETLRNKLTPLCVEI